jgi:hypothetical protein
LPLKKKEEKKINVCPPKYLGEVGNKIAPNAFVGPKY